MADSGTFTANAVGTWCLRGEYTSNTSNYTGSSDSTLDECFTVKDTTTASSAQNWLPNDSATITSTDPNSTVTGTIRMTLYAAADCNGAVVPNQSYTSTTFERHAHDHLTPSLGAPPRRAPGLERATGAGDGNRTRTISLED